jgi:hypothetical protein
MCVCVADRHEQGRWVSLLVCVCVCMCVCVCGVTASVQMRVAVCGMCEVICHSVSEVCRWVYVCEGGCGCGCTYIACLQFWCVCVCVCSDHKWYA